MGDDFDPSTFDPSAFQSSDSSPIPTWGLLFIGFVLLVFLAIGIAAIVQTFKRRRAHGQLSMHGVRGTATVVDNRITSHPGSDGDSSELTFEPVVVLDKQDDAKPVVVPSPSRSSYVVGTTIDVFYDPANPSRIDTIASPGIAGYVIGTIAMAVPVVFATVANSTGFLEMG